MTIKNVLTFQTLGKTRLKDIAIEDEKYIPRRH